MSYLYEKWLATARTFKSERALIDIAAGKSWSFEDLLRESERTNLALDGIIYPQGSGPEFIFSTLQAWRAGSITCPLEASQSPPQLPTPPPGIAHLKLTSATTGAPKCIAFTGLQLAADAANIVSTMRLTPTAPNLACISLAHSYGFSNLILPLLLHGIPLILLPAPLPELLLRAAKQFPSITLPAVPALWKTWHQSTSIPPNTAIAISAGAPLPLELESVVFQKTNLKIHNFYGSSECGGIAYDRTATPRTAPNCVGSALDNVALSLSESGTLVIESAAVGETYFPEPQSSLHPGRFETADLAELRDQLVFLHGRASDLLNIAGRKATPESIEAILRAHPAVVECIVFGIQSDDRADTVVAALNTKEKTPISDLTNFLSQKLPAWQIPRRWWFTKDLVPNVRGKISRAEWKRRYLEETSK
jgi:long-chain acyl-CoA synthetase